MSGSVGQQAGRAARRGMRPHTVKERRRLYVVACASIERYYQRSLTLEALARVLATSPRQIQRAFEQFGERTFKEELLARRMGVGSDTSASRRVSRRAPTLSRRARTVSKPTSTVKRTGLADA